MGSKIMLVKRAKNKLGHLRIPKAIEASNTG